MEKEQAFSGLEAAIVLIAFVVVAAVFSYVMLGAGFFATQKSQEVTYSGIQQTTSNLVLDGNVYGDVTAGDTHALERIYFWLTIPVGGSAQDVKQTNILMTSTDKNSPYTLVYTAGTTPVADTFIAFKSNGVDELDPTTMQAGDRVKLVIQTSSGNTGQPTPGQVFTLEIKPKTGASTLITKTLQTGYAGGVIN